MPPCPYMGSSSSSCQSLLFLFWYVMTIEQGKSQFRNIQKKLCPSSSNGFPKLQNLSSQKVPATMENSVCSSAVLMSGCSLLSFDIITIRSFINTLKGVKRLILMVQHNRGVLKNGLFMVRLSVRGGGAAPSALTISKWGILVNMVILQNWQGKCQNQ